MSPFENQPTFPANVSKIIFENFFKISAKGRLKLPRSFSKIAAKHSTSTKFFLKLLEVAFHYFKVSPKFAERIFRIKFLQNFLQNFLKITFQIFFFWKFMTLSVFGIIRSSDTKNKLPRVTLPLFFTSTPKVTSKLFFLQTVSNRAHF